MIQIIQHCNMKSCKRTCCHRFCWWNTGTSAARGSRRGCGKVWVWILSRGRCYVWFFRGGIVWLAWFDPLIAFATCRRFYFGNRQENRVQHRGHCRTAGSTEEIPTASTWFLVCFTCLLRNFFGFSSNKNRFLVNAFGCYRLCVEN